MIDANGRVVRRLVEGVRGAGPHSEGWDASTSPAGIYFVRLEFAGRAVTRKIIRIP